MKCPECEEMSTFTHEWTGTIEFWAPLTVDNDGDIEIDYDNFCDSGIDSEDSDESECRCDKCGAAVTLDNIEVVDTEEDALAA